MPMSWPQKNGPISSSKESIQEDNGQSWNEEKKDREADHEEEKKTDQLIKFYILILIIIKFFFIFLMLRTIKRVLYIYIYLFGFYVYNGLCKIKATQTL